MCERLNPLDCSDFSGGEGDGGMSDDEMCCAAAEQAELFGCDIYPDDVGVIDDPPPTVVDTLEMAMDVPSDSPSKATLTAQQLATIQRNRAKAMKKKAAKAPQLSPEQEVAVRIAVGGHNMFLSGQAGTGKSVTLRAIVSRLRTVHPEQGAVSIVATTGMAAAALKAKTLHDWAGISGNALSMTAHDVCGKAKASAWLNWRSTKVLIVEEVSMLDGRLLDLLEWMSRELREPRPDGRRVFGGIQVIFAGDFGQLPPVEKEPVFAFESTAWKALRSCGGANCDPSPSRRYCFWAHALRSKVWQNVAKHDRRFEQTCRGAGRSYSTRPPCFAHLQERWGE